MYINTERNLDYNININKKRRNLNEKADEFIRNSECSREIKAYLRQLIRRDHPKAISSRKYAIKRKIKSMNYCRTCGQNVSHLFDSYGTRAYFCPYCGQAFSSYYIEKKTRQKVDESDTLKE